MKVINIIHICLTVIIIGFVILLWTTNDHAIKQPPIVIADTTTLYIDSKLEHMVDSILKAVSKTDAQLIDIYIQQQTELDDLKTSIQLLNQDLARLRNFSSN